MHALNARKRSFLATLAGLAAAAAISCSPAQAQTVMKMASATIYDVQYEWQKVFKQELEARVGGQVTVELYPASQLGTIPRMLEGVLFGTIESFITPTGFLSGTERRFEAFDMPGLFDSAEQVGATLHDPSYRDHLETMALDADLRVIGAIYNSPILLLSSNPVQSIQDFQGLKVRTFATPLQIAPMEAVGASALPLPLSEVIPALQSGNIDGMLAGMPILTAFKFYDVARYVTDLRFATVVSVNVVNETWFQSQTPEVQAAIREAGRAAEQAVLPWGIANVERANQAWIDNGGEIIGLPPEERAQMMAEFERIGLEIIGRNVAAATELELLQDTIEKVAAE